MILRVLYVLSFLILFPNKGISQVKTIDVTGHNYSWTIRYITDNEIISVIGSPYLNQDWMAGTLTLKNNDSLRALFRFNVLEQQMEMIYGKDTLLITSPSDIRSVSLSNKNFMYLPVIEKINGKEFIRFAYCELILPGQIELFRIFKVDIRNNSYASNYMGGGGDGRDYYFHESKLLYKGKNQEVLRELPGNVKKLAVAFGVDYPALKQVIRDQKLDISRDDDIINLLLSLGKSD
jgi:hypothetical protein